MAETQFTIGADASGADGVCQGDPVVDPVPGPSHIWWSTGMVRPGWSPWILSARQKVRSGFAAHQRLWTTFPDTPAA